MAQLVLGTGHKYTMQIKYYSILDTADWGIIQAWVADPNHHCVIIAQGRVDAVTHRLCVRQPSGIGDVITPTESALGHMIEETEWPE
jgi:hypothetical protein